MNCQRLPYAPPPYTDEVLSSWIERIGIFYGIGLLGARTLLTPTVWPVEWAKNEDLDTCYELRRLAVTWTGRDGSSSPAVWSESDSRMLEVSARLAYCPKCWDDDADNGRAPYIRRAWARWACVSCPSHKNWLAARMPGIGFGSTLNGWAAVWQSSRNWAQAAGLPYDPNRTAAARTFEPDSLKRPDCSWTDFEHQLAGLASTPGNADPRVFHGDSVLGAVVRPELIGVRAKILRALQIRTPTVLVSDLDLRGYRRKEPGWISERIACLVMALDITRLEAARAPVLRDIRAIIEGSHCLDWNRAAIRRRHGAARPARCLRQNSWQSPDARTRE